MSGAANDELTPTRVTVERIDVAKQPSATGVFLVTEDRMSGFFVTTPEATAKALRPGDVVDLVLRRVAQ